jgi:uncharacterized phage protein (TIGR02218 family)
MSRTLTSGYEVHLQQEVQQRAVCVKITRSDATVLGFTSFDSDLTFDGTLYEAEAAIDVTEVRSGVGTGVDNLEGMGALISDRITDVELLAGLYDGASVELFELVWSDTALGRLIYLTGSLGEFEIENPGRYKTELRSLSQHLAQQIVELASPQCRVKQLGDARCFVGGTNYSGAFTMADYRTTQTVVSVQSLTEITFTQSATQRGITGVGIPPTGYYDQGRVEFLTGLNAGLEREVKSSVLSAGNGVLTLQIPFPFLVAPGDSAILEAGCSRLLEVCRDRFLNVGNIRAEPHLPGTDAILKRGRR